MANDNEFQSWYKSVSSGLGLNPDPYHPEHFYDFRGYYDAMQRGTVPRPSFQPEHGQVRFPDEFKLPGHPNPPGFMLESVARGKGWLWTLANGLETLFKER